LILKILENLGHFERPSWFMTQTSLFWALVAAAPLAFASSAFGQSEPIYGPPSVRVDPATAVPEIIEPAPPGIPIPLAQAIDIASRDHPLVLRALADRRSSSSNLRGARWQRFPSLSVEGLAVTQGSQTGAQDGIAANVILEQPLYTFGRVDGTIDAARAALESSTYAIADAQIEITLRTISAYFDLSLATEREKVLQDSLVQHGELLETIHRRVLQEISPTADFDLASSRVAQIEQELAAVAGLRATSFSQLMELIGYAELELGAVPEFNNSLILPDEAEIIAAALECSPRLKSLRALRSEVDAERRIARARLFPQLSAQASANEITGTRFGVSVRLQTGNGLSQFAAVDAAAAQVVSAEYQIALTEREIRERVRADYLTYVAGKNRSIASQRATKSSELVTESYKRQFITGRRTWLDVMNAVRESQAARLTEADAQLGAMAAYSRIIIQSCRWGPVPIGSEY
jgi:adhesin transport system outer membrane protein